VTKITFKAPTVYRRCRTAPASSLPWVENGFDLTAVRSLGQLYLKRMPLALLTDCSRAEKRNWLRHCPAALIVGSSARSFKMIGISRGKKPPVLKVKN